MLTVKTISREESLLHASRFLDHNYVQLWDYAELAALRTKSVSEQVKIEAHGVVIGMADVRIKSIPAINTGIAYINRGPITSRDHFDAELFSKCLEALVDEYVGNRNFLLRIQAPIATPDDVDSQEVMFRKHGFDHVGRGYHTIVKKIDSDEALLLQSLNKKWRSELRRSQKTALQISRTTDLVAFDEFEELFDGLKSTKGFSVDLGIDFYKQVQQRLPKELQFVIHTANIGGEPVAGHIGSYLGNVAVYLFGASSEYGREIRAAYSLHWEVMRYASGLGIDQYDLGGVDPDSNPGVFRFKNRFNGHDVFTAGVYQKLPSGFAGNVLLSTERLYNWLRRLF